MQQQSEVPTSTPLDEWLARLGKRGGEPGGGAASGVMLGIAASLLRMVAEYTADDPRAREAAARLAGLRLEALEAIEADGVHSASLGAALALSPDDPTRERAVRQAAIDATESSARLGEIGERLVPEGRLLAEIGNPHVAADLAVAAGALVAGMSGALINLRADLQLARRHGASPSMLDAFPARASSIADAAGNASALIHAATEPNHPRT